MSPPTDADTPWHGIASFSESVLCLKEPFNTKPLFGRIAARAFERLTERLGTVRFVQVGANDGVHADHLHPFIVGGRWEGVLIEPAPDPFDRLTRTYAGIDGLQFVCKAISCETGSLPFYYVEGEDGLSSFSLETILAHSPKYDDLPGMIRTMAVETETLDALCDRMGIARPDVIAVDTEGTDDLVLQSFDLEGRRPKLVLFEHCHLSAQRSAALRDRIVGAGYRLVHDRHDALAIAPDALDPAEADFFADLVALARANPGDSAL